MEGVFGVASEQEWIGIALLYLVGELAVELAAAPLVERVSLFVPFVEGVAGAVFALLLPEVAETNGIDKDKDLRLRHRR